MERRPLSRAALVFASAAVVTGCAKATAPSPPDAAPVPNEVAADAEAESGQPVLRNNGGAVPPYGVAPFDLDGLSPTSTTSSDSRPPEGNLKVGTPAFTVPIPKGEEALKPFHGRLRACYTRGLVRNQTMAGRVILSATIAQNGVVMSSEPAVFSGIDRPTADCAAAVIKRVTFAAPGGTGSTMTLNLDFSLGDAHR